ncbi:MAG: hypothetical protein N4A33_11895 [Bacteriovoracaceae bacterium]|jgi:hypothetical protein|nr:hypothetical protein [Bacteriovoracaceae bacterium]
MKFSNKIEQLSKNPKRHAFSEGNSLTIELPKLEVKITLFYALSKNLEGEVIVDHASYKTDLHGPYLGVLDGFVSLMDSKAVEAIDRFPIKELDYFLRDEQATPCISAYTDQMYEILSIGEALKNKVFNKTEYQGPVLEFNFLESSVSEQLDFVEELFSYHFYNKNHYLSKYEIDDIEDNIFKFNTFDSVGDDDGTQIQEFLEYHLKFKLKVIINQ